MSTEIDDALGRMTPQELAEFEGELDKKSSELQVAQLYATGVKMAREAAAHYEKTGQLSPLLIIVKAAAEGKTADPIDAELDKMSEEDLVAFEKELDQKIAQDKTAEEYVEQYLEVGRKMARNYVEGLGKDAAPRIPKIPVAPPAGPGLGSKLMNIAKEHPLATAGAGVGLGYLMGDRK